MARSRKRNSILYSILRLCLNEQGLSTIEYAVLFIIIVIGAISVWNALGSSMLTKVSDGRKTFQAVLEGTGESNKSLGYTSRSGNNTHVVLTQPIQPANGEQHEQSFRTRVKRKREATPGKIIAGEPITDPQVKEALREAYEDSLPVKKGENYNQRPLQKWPREQGITGTTPGFFDRLFGNEYSIERWDEGPLCNYAGCTIDIPENITDGSIKDEIRFTAHIHPLETPERYIGEKDYEMYKEYEGPAPHYIIAPEGVYRFTTSGDDEVITEHIGTLKEVLY